MSFTARVISLLLLTARAKSSWGSWLGQHLTSGLSRLSHAANELENARSAAQSLRVDGPALTLEQLELPLLGARLADLAYAESRWELEAGLRDAAAKWQMHERIDGDRLALVRFEPQRVQLPTPQWYLARSADALWLVFRGTYSAFDVLHDLMATPEPGGEGDSFHGGFLRAVQEVADEVRDALFAELQRGAGAYERVYLVGHSLGGALALTLLGAGLLDRGGSGSGGAALPPVSVLTYGAPAAFHKRCRSGAVRAADVQAFVYGADVVPRLLGSPLPLLRRAVTHGLGSADTWSHGALDTLAEYVHPLQQRLVYVDPRGVAQRVPPKQREGLLHLHQALDLESVRHHGQYASGLERAWRVAAAEVGAAARGKDEV